ncbi:ABC transporter ATP-binding protein [Pelagibius sp. Alg239-R121]|uniref:ABC transporter ATP-binding protein n=1 Tax=Pelagibius sp. Alg239-R121 TaxID=2993448 RepID=UPI0024A6CAD4|nr:ATP-binding cassette domain-containing protein [Pelagibius sp. Alg239-R121]
MVAVSFNNVWKDYGGGAIAVKDLNMEIKDGEFVSLLGPSGCGKSTSLRMLAGLEHISSGEIVFGDKVVNDLPPKDRDIAMVFENYALYPHKTIFDNIANPLKQSKVAAAEIERRVTEAAKLLEIDQLLERRPQELSGGQKQRTAIGRAIVRQPQVFLFDEPIAHLDAKLRARMRGELKHLQFTLGVTTIYVTHDQLEALTMADRIAVMNDGVLQQFGTPQEVYDNPANSWVATFVGEPQMSLMEMQVTSLEGETALAFGSYTIEVDPKNSARLRAAGKKDLLVGVRPDKATVSLDESLGSIRGEVYSRQLLGADVLVEVEIGKSRVRAKANTSFAGTVGTPCYLNFGSEDLYFFDAKDGQVIPQ